MNLRDLLKRHEGFRAHPYKDTVGKLTIAFGRNLDDVGVSEDEAELMLSNDIERARMHCELFVPGWDTLDPVRRDVLMSMFFNMGAGAAKFVRMLDAVKKHKWDEAAEEMIRSKWATQVKDRAVVLAEMMRTGHYPANPEKL